MRARSGCAVTFVGAHTDDCWLPSAYHAGVSPSAASHDHDDDRESKSGGATRPADSGVASTIPSPAPVPDSYGKPVSTEVGLASWYGPPYAGRKGADGTVYDQNAMTAAHLTLPMGTMVRVTKPDHKSIRRREDHRSRTVCARADYRPVAGGCEVHRRLSRWSCEGKSGGIRRTGSGQCRSRRTLGCYCRSAHSHGNPMR